MKALSALCSFLLAAIGLSAAGWASVQVRIMLATIPASMPAVRLDGSIPPGERPGFRVEVLRAAAKSGGATVNIVSVPWLRALDLVKTGTIDGAFSTSWSQERSMFGVFTMRNGTPDPLPAMKGYTCELCVHPGSSLKGDGQGQSCSPSLFTRPTPALSSASGACSPTSAASLPTVNWSGRTTMASSSSRRSASGPASNPVA